jgi:vacuolar-type H+-ATPase catalytic subunit A/Vma1
MTWTVRVAKAPFRAVDQDRMQKILAQEDEVLKIAKLADTETLHFLEDTFIRISVQETISEKSVTEEMYAKIMQWLSVTPYYHHQLSPPHSPCLTSL